MPLSLRLGLAAFLIIPSLPTWAMDILPGLWEITPRGVQLGGQTLPDLGAVLAQLENLPPEQRQNIDRKSTRLNSSHVKISYAVFCLKKKKNRNKKTVVK